MLEPRDSPRSRSDQGAIVVTGAAGFIGSRIAARLRSCRLVLVDRVSVFRRSLNVGSLNAEFIDADEFLARIEHNSRLPALDAVIHIGAETSTTATDVDYLRRNNTEYTRVLAEWCMAHGVRFIYASSAATYGNGDRGYSDDLSLLHQLKPLNPYGRSKHDFDLWAHEQGVFDRITGLKYFNVYGPNEAHKGDMRSMVLRAFEQIQATGRVRLFKSYRSEYLDGEQKRDFIYVDDAVEMTLWFLDQPEATGLFNIGTGVERTWNDLAAAVFVAMGRAPSIEYIEMPEAIRPNYQYSTQADLSRLRAAGCEIEPRRLEEGVRDYVQKYLLPA